MPHVTLRFCIAIALIAVVIVAKCNSGCISIKRLQFEPLTNSCDLNILVEPLEHPSLKVKENILCRNLHVGGERWVKSALNQRGGRSTIAFYEEPSVGKYNGLLIVPISNVNYLIFDDGEY